jgi:hypothetical protein
LTSNPARIAYTPRPDATPDAELAVLARVYKFVLETKKAVEPAPEPDDRDAVKESSGYDATNKYNRRSA